MNFEERIKEVFSDEVFVKQLLEQEEAEQVQELLRDKEIDLSIEDIAQIKDMVGKMANGEMNPEELSEDDLESVAGGIALCPAMAILGFFAFMKTVDIVNEATKRRW